MPLFPNSERRQRAERELQRLQEMMQNPSTSRQTLLTAAKSLRQLLPASNRILTRQIDGLVNTLRKSLIDETSANAKSLLNYLGPVGRTIKTALDVRAHAQTIAQASDSLSRMMKLIQHVSGGDSQTPEEAGGQPSELPQPIIPRPPIPPSNGGSGLPAVEALPPGVTREGGIIHIRAGGYNRRLSVNDPIVTGKMVRVRSSNVHSIGFRIDLKQPANSKLIVRYLAPPPKGQTARTQPGPTYAYNNCHPDMFTFMRRAASKGKFVWDNLRIRGSRVAHRHTYKLIGIVDGYVPRKATVQNGLEKYLKRAVRTSGGNVIRSSLPERVLGKIDPKVARYNVNGR